MDHKDVELLANWIEKSNYTVILTGAGMSTESGLADFRSREGLWSKLDPMKLASVRTLMEDYDSFYDFYKMRLEVLSEARPHQGYRILADWEDRGLINSIVTQNVDDFHLLAGNKNVYRLHGSLNDFRCSLCHIAAEKEDYLQKKPCNSCGGSLRPGVVLFGEGLPEKTLYAAMGEMERAELLIVIGTSLSVFPVNQLPDITKGKRIYINKEIEGQGKFDLVFESRAGELLQEVDKLI
ncbi:MAG: NAD-dependent deacylase [Tissierellaceae bacterium]